MVDPILGSIRRAGCAGTRLTGGAGAGGAAAGAGTAGATCLVINLHGGRGSDAGEGGRQ